MGAAKTKRVGVRDIYSAKDAEQLLKLKGFCPDYFNIIEEFGLKTLWQRDGLSPREKELIVLGSLITLGDCAQEIQQHFFSAQQRGVALSDIQEIIILLTAYIGVPRTLNAINQIYTLTHSATNER